MEIDTDLLAGLLAILDLEAMDCEKSGVAGILERSEPTGAAGPVASIPKGIQGIGIPTGTGGMKIGRREASKRHQPPSARRRKLSAKQRKSL